MTQRREDADLAMRLQAHVSRELPQDEQETIDAMLQTDPSIRRQHRDLQDQETDILMQLRSIQIEPSPTDVEAALARFHQRHRPANESTESTENIALESWWQQLARLFQSHISVAMATCTAAGIAVLLITPPPGAQTNLVTQPIISSGRTTPPTMRAKGTGQPLLQREKRAYLYLGTVARSGKVTRLGTGETCGVSQRLYFAFQLKASGYPYLLLREQRDDGGNMQLYPFTEKPVLWQQGYHEIQRAGTPQLYRLQRHRGLVAFALLWSPTPLAKAAVDAIRRRCRPFATEGQRCSYLRQHHPTSSLDVIQLTIRSLDQRKQP